MRALLSTELTPEATTGIIVGFCVTGFILLGLAAYASFLTARFRRLELRVFQLESHPKLQKTEADA